MDTILINNDFVNRKEGYVDIEDRGYQFGDGVCEVIRVYNKKTFTMNEHLERLVRSANRVAIQMPYSQEELKTNILSLIEKNNIVNGTVYVQITRGVSKRNHAFPVDPITPQIIAYTNHVERPLKEMSEGVSALLTDDIRWLRCDIKSLNLLGNVLAKQKAIENDCYEAIQHRNGIVTEGSSSNIFIVKDGTLMTHPANNFILNGITRLKIIEICKKNGISFEERPFPIDELLVADEVFLTSTTAEIIPITKAGNLFINDQKIGNVTRKLQELLEQEF